MDWDAPYRADVREACQAAWQLAQQADDQRLPEAVRQVCQALRRWLLLPTHLPGARQHLATLLQRLERVCPGAGQEDCQAKTLAAGCAQLQQLMRDVQGYL